MTNKPMLSVERDLVERITNPFGDPHDKFNAVQELRALLDKPVAEGDFESWWAETGEQLTEHEIGLKDLMQCAYESKPAAQPHGEPAPITDDMDRLMEAYRRGEFSAEGGSDTVEALSVASLDAAVTGHDEDSYMAGYCAALCEQAKPFIGLALKPEHQGEIDLTPKRLAHAESVIEQQNNLIASLRAELVESYRIDANQQGDPVTEVEREFDNAPAHVHLYQDLPDGAKLYAEQPAPVAVVMPEKKSVPEPEDYNTNIDEVAFAEGYNDALDDVARLNVVNP